MGIDCGSQVAICDVPIRLDTYKGCSHGCRYCFAKRNSSIEDIKPLNCIKQLKNFINGSRPDKTSWCDWDIPLHWGGMSDPFQPCERLHGISKKALKVFAETQYPFIVSTKGEVIAEKEYLQLISECNSIVQVSMVSPMFDRIEAGCPTYAERLKMCEKIAPNTKRLIVRIQPYITDCLKSILDNLPRLADAGVYGVILEGFKAVKAVKGMVKIGVDYAYPYDVLESHFSLIKDKAHEVGLKFYSGENRIRAMGDSLTCCGCDGLEGFKPNKYNLSHLVNGDNQKATEQMQKPGTSQVFRGTFQDSVSNLWLKDKTFEQVMNSEKTHRAIDQCLIKGVERKYKTDQEKLKFTTWLRSTGITPKEVDDITETQMSTHYLCGKIDGQLAIPTPEQFNKLRKHKKIKEVPQYIERLVYE